MGWRYICSVFFIKGKFNQLASSTQFSRRSQAFAQNRSHFIVSLACKGKQREHNELLRRIADLQESIKIFESDIITYDRRAHAMKDHIAEFLNDVVNSLYIQREELDSTFNLDSITDAMTILP